MTPPGTAVVAILSYDSDAEEGHEMSVQVTEIAAGFLSTLTDNELKVFAAEAGIRIRRALEMPPSPDKST